MLKIRHIFLIVLFSFVFSNALAQKFGSNNPGKRFKRKKEKLSWIFGGGWNIVDDNGSPFKKLFDVAQSWNVRFYPSQLSAEVLRHYGMSYGASFSFNQYTPGKVINRVDIVSDTYNFFAIDAFAKYHFKEHIKLPPRLDPYAPGGFSYTVRTIGPYYKVFTFNLGLGVNIWINKIVGINFQSMAKFGLRAPIIKTGSNYLQHSFGLVFILDRTSKRKYSFIKARYPWVHEKRPGMERE